MGPIDHGMCKSMYLAAPEGIVLELATSTARIEVDEWLDPEVVALCGIDETEVARFRSPSAFTDQAGAVPQPDPARRPDLHLPPEMEALRSMGDVEIAALMDFPTPPVRNRVQG